MKKEIIAAGVLVLILAVSLFNIWFIDKKTEELATQIIEAGGLMEQGDNEKAAEALKASLEDWKRINNYVNIMLHHEVIDPITDEYYVVLEELERGEATTASFDNLLENIGKLSAMERLNLGSIF